MNNVNIIGNLTKDVELRYNGDKPIANFRIAINGYADHTDFIPVTVFGKQAEACNMYLKKGSKVGISGRISTGSYEKDGKTFYTWNVTAVTVDFLDRKEKAEKFSIGVFEPTNEDIPF